MNKQILLDDGSGGKASQRLVKDLFLHHFDNPILANMDDAAVFSINGKVAMSTDGYTVDPLEFPGGNIGSLAVHGTVNDISMMGAVPLYLSCGFILEEGLSFSLLETIVTSMAMAAREAGVSIVTGDTKVVGRGAVDKVFITTTGIGEIRIPQPPSGKLAKEGDAVLISGTMGEHGMVILGLRAGLSLSSNLKSDSASLNHMTQALLKEVGDIHVLRDPTRGGLATTLNEIAQQSSVNILIKQDAIPILPDVVAGCSVLGLDPLYLANEGKLICILPEEKVEPALAVMKRFPQGQGAIKIGNVGKAFSDKVLSGNLDKVAQVLLETSLGGHRLLGMLEGEQLPRIC